MSSHKILNNMLNASTSHQLTPMNHSITYLLSAAAHYTGGQVNKLCAAGQYKMQHFEIFTFENYRDIETRAKGKAKSLTTAPFDRSYMTT